MQLGMIGLGRMGANLTRRLMRNGHEVVVYNQSREPIRQLERGRDRGRLARGTREHALETSGRVGDGAGGVRGGSSIVRPLVNSSLARSVPTWRRCHGSLV